MNIFYKNEKGEALIGSPHVKGIVVEASVISQIKDKKIIVFKKKRRHNYRRKIGHRQELTLVKIENILSSTEKKQPKDSKVKDEGSKKSVEIKGLGHWYLKKLKEMKKINMSAKIVETAGVSIRDQTVKLDLTGCVFPDCWPCESGEKGGSHTKRGPVYSGVCLDCGEVTINADGSYSLAPMGAYEGRDGGATAVWRTTCP